MLVATATRRFLASPLVDLLVGPHGIDRYLELIRPNLTLREARAEVVGVRRQTGRSVTLTLRPNQAWGGFSAGQFAAVGVEIGGVRRTRTYSPAGSQHGRDGAIELTVTSHPDGVVSNHLRSQIAPGSILTSALEIVASNDELRDPMEKATPMRRLGDPDDIAAAAVYLASPAASFLTGKMLEVDGGLTVPNLDLPIPDL